MADELVFIPRARIYADDANGTPTPVTKAELLAGLDLTGLARSSDISALGALLAQIFTNTDTLEALDAQRNTLLTSLQSYVDGLETLAGNTNSLLTTQGTYLDQVETLLTTLGTYEDGVEGLLSTLGVKNDNLLAKLEQLRVLLAATLVTRTNFPASVLAGQSALPVGSGVTTLTVPGTATYAEIEVISGAAATATAGAVRWSKSPNIAAGPATRVLNVGDVVRLRGAEMAAFKATRDQATDAMLHVEYGVDA